MTKQGHHLRDIVPDFPEKLLESLRDEFSISTAEEFISMVARADRRMRIHLHVTEAIWSKALKAARAVLSDAELKKLETPAKKRFGKGVITKKRNPGSEDLEQYITYE